MKQMKQNPGFSLEKYKGNKMIDVSEYISPSEAAKLLGISRATLHKWNKKNILTKVEHPLNRRMLYKKSEIELLIKK